MVMQVFRGVHYPITRHVWALGKSLVEKPRWTEREWAVSSACVAMHAHLRMRISIVCQTWERQQPSHRVSLSKKDISYKQGWQRFQSHGSHSREARVYSEANDGG